MASNLSCIGFAVASEPELSALVGRVLPRSARLGTADGVDVFRFEDGSGARLVIGVRGREIADFLPSFAGRPGVRLSGCRPLNDDVISAAVVDEDGEQLTSMAFELEQRRALDPAAPVTGAAAIAAFGGDVSVHASAEDFASSPASLLDRDADPDEPPPPHVVERGLTWPTRMAPESFISYGVFGEPEQAEAYARMNGIVVTSERRRNGVTGNAFVVSRVRCLGFEVDLLLDGADFPEPLAPGSVIAGTVFLVGSVDALAFGPAGATGRPRRRWWPGRR